MDKSAQDKHNHGTSARDNRANQLNPNHEKTGTGHSAGYQGQGGKADLDNHANQMNPNWGKK